MDPPRSRYQVIEKDRRLIVLDRGEPVKTLVHHSHPVVTPGRMRAEAHTDRLAGPPVKSRRADGRSARTDSLSPTTPRATAYNGKSLGRIAASIAIMFFLLIFFWPFLVPLAVVGWVLLGFIGSKEDPGYRKLFRAYARWIAAR